MVKVQGSHQIVPQVWPLTRRVAVAAWTLPRVRVAKWKKGVAAGSEMELR